MWFEAGDAAKSWGANVEGSPVMAAADLGMDDDFVWWRWGNGRMGRRRSRPGLGLKPFLVGSCFQGAEAPC